MRAQRVIITGIRRDDVVRPVAPHKKYTGFHRKPWNACTPGLSYVYGFRYLKQFDFYLFNFVFFCLFLIVFF